MGTSSFAIRAILAFEPTVCAMKGYAAMAATSIRVKGCSERVDGDLGGGENERQDPQG
jgi:hypothetical protein